MNAINWLLINLGNAAAWLWGVIKAFCGHIWAALDAVLNPVLSPLLAWVNPVCTAIGDGVYAVLSPLPVWVGLVLLSAIVGVLMLIGFRYTSNQAAIGRARDTISANLLALKLFKDEFGVALRAQGRLLGALLRLQGLMLLPILIMALPLVLVVAQMGLRYQWRPLRPGEQTLIKLHVNPGTADLYDAVLETSGGIEDATGPVPGGGSLVWRIRAGEPGRHTLRFNVSGTVVEKELVVGDGLQRVSAKRPGRRWTSQILHPVERRLPADAPVQSIEIEYPGVDSWVYGADYWVLTFFVVSMAAALVFKPVFKVRF